MLFIDCGASIYCLKSIISCYPNTLSTNNCVLRLALNTLGWYVSHKPNQRPVVTCQLTFVNQCLIRDTPAMQTQCTTYALHRLWHEYSYCLKSTFTYHIRIRR